MHALGGFAAGAAAQGAQSELGTAQNPLVMMQAEQSLGSQLWRTLRTLGVAFLIISGVGVLMEDKGLGRGILNNPDMKPQMDMKTTLADVKGVDEAKVGPWKHDSPGPSGACLRLHSLSKDAIAHASFDVSG